MFLSDVKDTRTEIDEVCQVEVFNSTGFHQRLPEIKPHSVDTFSHFLFFVIDHTWRPQADPGRPPAHTCPHFQPYSQEPTIYITTILLQMMQTAAGP